MHKQYCGIEVVVSRRECEETCTTRVLKGIARKITKQKLSASKERRSSERSSRKRPDAKLETTKKKTSSGDRGHCRFLASGLDDPASWLALIFLRRA